MTAFQITGEIIDIGAFDDSTNGLCLRTDEGQHITVTGLTVEQVRELKELAFTPDVKLCVGKEVPA